MIANDLRDMMIKYCSQGKNGENEVAIKTVGRAPGGVDCSPVTHLVNGGDWNAGKLFLVTEDRLLLAPKK